jgi:hypothetical protein
MLQRLGKARSVRGDTAPVAGPAGLAANEDAGAPTVQPRRVMGAPIPPGPGGSRGR